MISPHLVVLRAKVDAHFRDALARSPDSFACRAGCDRCCHQRFGVFEVEAAPIRAALVQLEQRDPALRERVRARGRDAQLDSCALLVDGRCSVYEQRPLICRSHGLPIAVPDQPDPVSTPSPTLASDPVSTPRPALRVDHCPLNFTDGAIPRESVLVLDAVNRPLAVLAELEAAGRPRVDLAQLAAEGPPERDTPKRDTHGSPRKNKDAGT